MKAPYHRIQLLFLAIMMISATVYSEPQAERERQQIQQAMASGHVPSVIAALPSLEQMWPKAAGEYFAATEKVVRFLRDSRADPSVQQALETIFVEVMDKRCPVDSSLAQASAYFDIKRKIIEYYFEYDGITGNKLFLLAVSSFLGEIRDQRVSGYVYRRPCSSEELLREAGLSSASDLSSPEHIKAHEKAITKYDHDMAMNGLQGSLELADRNLTFRLLVCRDRLRRDGNMDEKFALEVAENARLTEEERERTFNADVKWGSPDID